MAAIGEYYRVLGVETDATSEDVKKAFRKLARTCHPDVAGDDPASASKFGRIREAYETLVDPQRRARYDKRGESRSKSHIRNSWRPPGGWDGFSQNSQVKAAGRTRHKKVDIGLDDLFTQPRTAQADFGFGAKKGSPEETRNTKSADIFLDAEIPGRTARLGGTVTVRYQRTRRSSDGVNVYSYPEIYDLRVPPRSCTKDELRCERMGNFATSTNRYGDLVCRLNVGEETGTFHPRRDDHVGSSEPSQETSNRVPENQTGSQTVRISLVEALLGGRVRIDTPKGAVNVAIPPGTSSGKTLRLRGKAVDGGDWSVRVEIDVPKQLDDESRELIERFGELNPMEPRD
jgi:curved DNA-binding protein